MGEAKRRKQHPLTRPATDAACTAAPDASAPAKLEESPSAEHPAGDVDPRILAVEKFDRFAIQRNRLRKISRDAGQWAGLPMGIEGEELVIHPSYPWAHVLKRPEPKPREDRYARKVRNVIWSTRRRCDVAIYERSSDGMVECQPIIGTSTSVDLEMRTMGCSVAWGIEQESIALKLLGTLLPHHQFKYYLLTGQFIESSRRSGVIYMFRKLRPTIAMKANEKTGKMHVLCTLCMHPIGFYARSWAGAMCPTDDVIAHLMMMRGDEHMFWRYANQHEPGHPAAGI